MKQKIMDSAKLALLDDLSSSCQQAYYLKLVAASNKPADVNELEMQIKSLQEKIDVLRAQISKEWLLKIEEVHANVVKNKAELEDVVAELRREINVIENIAKGIDYFQKIVEMAARIAI